MKTFDEPRRARTPKPGNSSSKTMISVFGGTGAMARIVSWVSFMSKRLSGAQEKPPHRLVLHIPGPDAGLHGSQVANP